MFSCYQNLQYDLYCFTNNYEKEKKELNPKCYSYVYTYSFVKNTYQKKKIVYENFKIKRNFYINSFINTCGYAFGGDRVTHDNFNYRYYEIFNRLEKNLSYFPPGEGNYQVNRSEFLELSFRKKMLSEINNLQSQMDDALIENNFYKYLFDEYKNSYEYWYDNIYFLGKQIKIKYSNDIGGIIISYLHADDHIIRNRNIYKSEFYNYNN